MIRLFQYEFRVLELDRMGSGSWSKTERLSDLHDQGWRVAGITSTPGTIYVLLRRRWWGWQR